MLEGHLFERIEKRWGWEHIAFEGVHYQVKHLFMRHGQSCSMHYHEHKHETVTVIDGELVVSFTNPLFETVILQPGDCLVLPSGKAYAHKMAVTTDAGDDCLYLESACSGCNTDAIRVEEV
jgi:uncharacterized cupin superfamily protein